MKMCLRIPNEFHVSYKSGKKFAKELDLESLTSCSTHSSQASPLKNVHKCKVLKAWKCCTGTRYKIPFLFFRRGKPGVTSMKKCK